jgi:hypothetical protein
MANEDAIGRSKRQGQVGEEVQIRLIDLFAATAIGAADAVEKIGVEVDIRFGDRTIRPLGQFMIAGEIVNALRKLALQRAPKIDRLVRFLAAVHVVEVAVY